MTFAWKINISGDKVNIDLRNRTTAVLRLLSIQISVNRGSEVATKNRSSNTENHVPKAFPMIAAAVWSAEQCMKALKLDSQSESSTRSQTNINRGMLIETKNCVK
mmetsp:Transcript_34162/g.89483  ORF Transcript_34162/g.89483 Transcript_34162/m.89483 type:complete len:105 (-) Transcript_34162:247-561(-)